MAKYKLFNTAKEDLIRIHHYGVSRFGMRQADKYFNGFFICFEKIGKSPFSFEAVDHIRSGYRRCPYGSDTIYYCLSNDEVEIIAIIGKQDLKRKL